MRTTFASTTVPVLALIAMLAFSANDSRCQVVKDGLVAHWSFDEADIDGKTAKDVSGNSDGEIIGDPQVAEGKAGEGLELDGVAENIKIPSLDISPAVYPEITLMAWVFPTNTGVGGQKNRRFVFGHDDGGWDRGLLMQDSNWRVGTGNDGTDYWDTEAKVDVGVWQHVAVVYNAEDIKFYKDGAEYSYGSPGAVGDGNNSLLIGAHPSQARFFQGIIDEAYIYSRALSKAEIDQNARVMGTSVERSDKLSITWGEMKSSG
jgi:hypothetical protein